MPISPELADKRIREKIVSSCNDTYGLEKAVFTNTLEKATFICKKHGAFQMRPLSILKGACCPNCQSEKDKEVYVKKFIAEATAKHNGKYTYDNLNFTETREPITITCPTHGDQSMSIFTHLKGLGCPECSKAQTIISKTGTTEEFIEKSYTVHGDLYDYSESVYTGTNDPIKVICRKHGPFYPQPNNHYRGSKCPVCNDESKYLTQDVFISRGNLVHDGFYSYDKTNYTTHDTKVTITCPLHGDFEQTPSAHINSNQGCPACWEERRGKARKITNEEFITRAKEIHGDKYDYRNTVLGKDLRTHVTLVCPTHGEFRQAPGRHLCGDNCPKCAGKYKRSTEEYIVDAIKTHGYKFSYDKLKYVNNTTPVTIKCPVHGYVKMNPRAHLLGSGCTLCWITNGESKVEKWLIENDINYIREYSFKNIKFRYDFYLPELKIFIEYDGQLHYIPVNYFGGEKTLRKIQENDKLKDDLAKLHGINMIRIPYTYYNELENYLLHKFSRIYKYKVDNTYYRNFLSLCRALDLPVETTVTSMEKYLVKK